jgi:ribosome-binding protein aMBF1 (putative translation factor)
MSKKWSEVRDKAVREGRLDERRLAAHKERLLAATRGHQLAELRRQAGLSAEEIARRLQVNEDLVLEIERGLIDQALMLTAGVRPRALGGEFKVTARFGDERLTIS